MSCKGGILIAAIIMVQPALSANMDEVRACHPHKPSQAREWWSYRIVDGRQCWFRGHPGSMPKSQLFWDRDQAKPEVKTETAIVQEPPQPQPLIILMRPRPGSMFEWHWRDLMIEMNQPVWTDRRLMQDWR
jgi:hypothetical protein